MQRIVTLLDLEQHPELISQGVSLNQYFDFDALEAVNETPPTAEQTTETIQEPIKPIKKKKATKPTQKKTPTKQKAKRK